MKLKSAPIGRITEKAGLLHPWSIAGFAALTYGLAVAAPESFLSLRSGEQGVLAALIDLTGRTGIALILVGVVLDFTTGLYKSFRSGMEHDHDGPRS